MDNAVDAPGPSLIQRLRSREMQGVPSHGARRWNLAVAVLATAAVSWQLVLAGGLATAILADLKMSFAFYANVVALGLLAGAVGAWLGGFADRAGRANLVVWGVGLASVLSAFVLPAVHGKAAFAVVFLALAFAHGWVLVAAPALVRDVSLSAARGSAMGGWVLGPLLGSLIASIAVGSGDGRTWGGQYEIAGIAGLVVFVIALFGLRDAPRDDDEELAESGARPFLRRHLLGLVLGGAFLLVAYGVAVAVLPVYFGTVFGYGQARIGRLGIGFWAVAAITAVIAGVASNRAAVRKPLMLAGGVGAVVFTTLFALRATHAGTGHGTFVLLLCLIAASLALAFVPWLVAFTESVERHAPARMAGGLAMWGIVVRVVLAVAIFAAPKVVPTATTLIGKGAAVQAAFSDTTKVGDTTVGAVTTAASRHADVIAKLGQIQVQDGELLAALGRQPAAATAVAQAQATGAALTAAQLKTIRRLIGAQAYAQLTAPGTAADLDYFTGTAPQLLGEENFAAIGAPTPPLAKALTTLASAGPNVAKAATASPRQWRTYLFIGVAGGALFVALLFLVAGPWDPRAGRRAAEA